MNYNFYLTVLEKTGINTGGAVPFTMIGTDYYIGFGGDAKNGIVKSIEKFSNGNYIDVISMVKNNKLSEKRENFDRLISDAFRYKRKNLKNNLKIYNIDVINKILNENGLNLSNRAEEIPLKVFISLSKADIFKN